MVDRDEFRSVDDRADRPLAAEGTAGRRAARLGVDGADAVRDAVWVDPSVARDRAGRDGALRRAAELEELAARTHERAAELYESWLRWQGRDRRGGLADRARMHREIATATRAVDCLAERMLRGLEVRVEAGTRGSRKNRYLAILSALGRLRGLIEQHIEEGVAASRREGATWAEIAVALRVTRQTAHQRYGRPGARPRPDGADAGSN